MDELWTSILGRLDAIEKNIEQIASFLRTKSSTLGERFPELSHQESEEPEADVETREEKVGYVPGRHFKDGRWID